MANLERILFVCHGNICRSPMAEFIMKALVRAKGLEGQYQIESAAVSSEDHSGRSGRESALADVLRRLPPRRGRSMVYR